jgi:hypothetical protein
MTIGEHGHLETCLNSKSCANHNFLYLSDLIVEGEYNDLPNLDLRTNVWSVIRMEVKNQKLTIKQQFKARPPSDTLQFCDLQKNPKDNKQYEVKI